MIKFGTAGLRGIMAPGDDNLNPQTITKATLAVSKFLKKPSRVVICYDSRENSRSYAELTASILGSKGHSASITSEAAPSPLLSYLMASSRYNFELGIMITASHNPREYNGYKVYHRLGHQLMPNDCHVIELYMDRIQPEEVNAALVESMQRTLFSSIDIDSVIESYFHEMLQFKIMEDRPDPVSLEVSYNPMHGVGARMIPKVLEMAGYHVKIKEKYLPDNGKFEHLPEPNPEIIDSAFPDLENETADILLATDPDADRIRMAYRDPNNGCYKVFNGHEIAVLLAYYLGSIAKDKGFISPYVVKSMVTTRMVNRVLQGTGVGVVEVPVGFKYIGYEAASGSHYGEILLGMEETLGYQVEDFSRDKDSIIIAVVLMDMISYFCSQNTNLIEVFNKIKQDYGDFYTEEISTPAANTKKVIDDLELAFLSSNEFKVINHNYDQKYPNNTLEISNRKESIYVRPSGTEPKLKFYYESTNKFSVERLKHLVNLVIGE